MVSDSMQDCHIFGSGLSLETDVLLSKNVQLRNPSLITDVNYYKKWVVSMSVEVCFRYPLG